MIFILNVTVRGIDIYRYKWMKQMWYSTTLVKENKINNLTFVVSLEGDAGIVLQPSAGIFKSYELDYLDCSRPVRSRLYLLPRTSQISRRIGMVALDRRIYYFLSREYVTSGKSDADFTHRNRVPCMDRNWSGWNGAGWNLLFPWAGNLLEDAVHIDAYSFNRWTESIIIGFITLQI